MWEEWPEVQGARPLIIVLRIEYDLARQSALARWLSRKPHIEQSNEEIRGLLKTGFATSNVRKVLDELPRVPAEDVKRWSRYKEVRKYSADADYGPQIDGLYQTAFSKEPDGRPRMRPLADELMKLLKGER